MTKTTGILVCAGHGDMLELTLPRNVEQLDHIYVVTKQEDDRTNKLCAKYSTVTTVHYDFKISRESFEMWLQRHKKGQHRKPPPPPEHQDIRIETWNQTAFNKGGGIRKAQQQAYQELPDYNYLVMDADVILHDNFKTTVYNMSIEVNELYSCDRRLHYKSWSDYLSGNIDSESYSLGVGWFQLYRDTSKLYDHYHTVAVSDVWFMNDFILQNDGTRSPVKRLPFPAHHMGVDARAKPYGKGQYGHEFFDFN